MKTILLVDDDKQLRVVFGMVLVRKGYRVVEAASGFVNSALKLNKRDWRGQEQYR